MFYLEKPAQWRAIGRAGIKNPARWPGYDRCYAKDFLKFSLQNQLSLYDLMQRYNLFFLHPCFF